MCEDYLINPNCQDGSAGSEQDQINAIQAGANAWNNEGYANFQFNYGGTTTIDDWNYDGHNVCTFVMYETNSIATTYYWTSWGNNVIECDIVFNDLDYQWSSVGDPSPWQMDIWNIAAHEFGHWLSLGHSSIYWATMYAYADYGETYKRDLHSDDQAGIQAIYGVAAEPPVADFTADPTTGPAPLEVSFTDLSSGTVTSWQWFFGDNTGSSDQNPVHTYSLPGTYTVTLIVSGPAGVDTMTKPDYIDVTIPPDLAFFATTPGGDPVETLYVVPGDTFSLYFTVDVSDQHPPIQMLSLPIGYDSTKIQWLSSLSYVYDTTVQNWDMNILSDPGSTDGCPIPGIGKIVQFFYNLGSGSNLGTGRYSVTYLTFVSLMSAGDAGTQMDSTEVCPTYYLTFLAEDGTNVFPWQIPLLILPQSLPCGDANADGSVNAMDIAFLSNYLFANGPPPDPLYLGDENCDGSVNINDIAYLAVYLFVGGPEPVCPCQW
jgi:PKD repeat protein